MPKSRPPVKERRRGPRASGPAVRDQLLEATARLLRHGTPRELSLRAIGDQAGVSPAMVSYYFGGKEGLLESLLERGLEALVSHLEETVPKAAPPDQLDALARGIVESMARTPWLPTLVVRGVVIEDGSQRRHFLERFAPRLSRLLNEILEDQRSAKRLRSGIDPKLAFLSLLGLTVYPFLVRPLAETVLGLSYDEAFRDRLLEHTGDVLHHGLIRGRQ